jgi:hypothetical protein
MSGHDMTTRIVTSGGDEWVGCTCGWVSPPLHGRGVADAAFFLHTLDVESLEQESNPDLAFF